VGRVIKAANAPMTLKNDEPAASLDSAFVIALALKAAERIVEAKIEADPSLLEKIFARALVAARGMEAAEVRVHPSDREAFDIDAAAAALGFTVCSDESVGRAGCRIVGRHGEVDASVPALTEAFRGALEKLEDSK
jgi:flagellar biosynthesis/type III secretory pathway protein FliH